MSKTLYFDGQKAIDFNNPALWTMLSGNETPKGIDRLYGVVSHLYRCVSLRANAVASMPYTLYKASKPIATWTGTDFEEELPPKMEWLNNLNDLLMRVEAASCLVGCAYWERQKNVLGTRDLGYYWRLPSSIHEIYNGLPGIGGMIHDRDLPYGVLMGFWRAERPYGEIRTIDTEDMVYFWYPDHAVEIGPAHNTPGRAVLRNAGVIQGMDHFLEGYFERGLIKATLLKYKDTLSQSEAHRVKEWWQRVVTGVRNAFATEIVRGDFEAMTIGEGIKDLRDNVLSKDEKEAIATGMGIPLSKLNSTSATDSNRSSDEVQFIEDTIIPEVGWIFSVLNEQVFIPQGMRIKAQPDTLKVMQEDETLRAAAWASYVNAGMSLEAATAVLGIDIPDNVELENANAILERDKISREMGLSEEAALQAANQEAGGDVEKLLLNGVQITAALQIVEKYAEGLFPRENAIQMYNAFLGIDPAIGQKLIPTDIPERKPMPVNPNQQFQTEQMENARSFVVMLDKYDESKRFERWLKNHPGESVEGFASDYLTHEEKLSLVYKARRNDKIPPLDDDKITPDDPIIDEIQRRFDKLFPDERGLLDATVSDA